MFKIFADDILADRGRGHTRSHSDSLHSKSKSQDSCRENSRDDLLKSKNSLDQKDSKMLKVQDADGRQRAYSHGSSTKPMNAAMAAMSKRKGQRASNSSLGSRKGSSGLGSNISLTDFFASEGNKKGSQSSIRVESTKTSPQHRDTEKLHRKEEILKAEVHLPRKQQHVSLEQLDVVEKSSVGENEKRKRKIAEFRMKRFNSTSTLFVDTCLVNSNIVEYLK
jgi:cell division protein FtsB